MWIGTHRLRNALTSSLSHTSCQATPTQRKQKLTTLQRQSSTLLPEPGAGPEVALGEEASEEVIEMSGSS